jgi:hypothetical protein
MRKGGEQKQWKEKNGKESVRWPRFFKNCRSTEEEEEEEEVYLVKRTSYEVPHYAVFSSLLPYLLNVPNYTKKGFKGI